MTEKDASGTPHVVHIDESKAARDGEVKRHDEVNNAAQIAKRAAEIKYNPWTKSMFRLYGCLLVAYFCGCLNGYDGSLMGGLNAMKSYQSYYHT